MGHKEVELAVVVVVEPYGSAGKSAAPYFRACRYIGEAAVAKISEEVVGAYRGDVDIVFAVVVIVAYGAAHAIHLECQACLPGAVGEGSVSVVVVKGGVVFG